MKNKKLITAADVATYVVCPEAWRLKFLGKGRPKETSRIEEGQKLRSQWFRKQDLSSQLRFYAKIAYLLLLALVIVVFIWEHRRIRSLSEKISNVPQPTNNIQQH